MPVQTYELITKLPEGFTIGADPELFCYKAETREYVPPLWLKGTKDNPEVVKCGALQQDGCAAEFNIDPVTDLDSFINNIKTVVKELRSRNPEGVKLKVISSALFNSEVFAANPELRILGCDPDFDICRNKMSDVINHNDTVDIAGGRFRYHRGAGGHVHVGWTNGQPVTSDNPHFYDACLMNLHVTNRYANISRFVERLGKAPWGDSAYFRRMFYGTYGTMRVKPYGVEVRCPSNMWLMSEQTIAMMFDATARGIIDTLEGAEPPQWLVNQRGNPYRRVHNPGLTFWDRNNFNDGLKGYSNRYIVHSGAANAS